MREQAQVDLAFDGEPGAVAFVAEGLGHAADHADFAATVLVGPALRGFTRRGRRQLLQRPYALQQADDLGRRHDLVHAPAIGGAHVHVFDEAQADARAFEMPGHRQDLVLIGAALDHHVDLDVFQPHGLRRLDAGQHIGDREIDVVHAPEHGVVQAVQADGDAVQPGVLQCLGLARQQRAIGGQRQVQRLAVRRAQRRQLGHQCLHLLTQQRFTTGDANLAHAMGHEQPCQPCDFLETQQAVVRQVRVVLVEHFLGHAVAAPEIAAVGDADAQVAQRAAEAVLQQAGRRDQVARGQGTVLTLVDNWYVTCVHGRGHPRGGLRHSARRRPRCTRR